LALSSPQAPVATAGAVGAIANGIGVVPQVVASSGPMATVTSSPGA
jgi:hypothetical protein